MNYGMYISASAASVQMARQDVLSNNLANVNTTAFKPDVLAVRQRDAVTVEDRLSGGSNELLERLGGGVMPMRMRLNVTPAQLESTNSPLDLGVEGDGFFMFRRGERAVLSRDGRMAVSPDGVLVSATSGLPVVTTDDEVIRVEWDQPIDVLADGRVMQGGQEVGRAALVTVASPESLEKLGDGMLGPPDGSELETLPASGRIHQGMLEGSGTNAVNAMIAVTGASRAVESALSMIGHINEMMGRAINTLGRVA